MQLTVNGRQVEAEVETLMELLRSEGVDTGQSGIAVAVNGNVIPRNSWGETVLAEGSVIEIITAMQGG